MWAHLRGTRVQLSLLWCVSYRCHRRHCWIQTSLHCFIFSNQFLNLKGRPFSAFYHRPNKMLPACVQHDAVLSPSSAWPSHSKMDSSYKCVLFCSICGQRKADTHHVLQEIYFLSQVCVGLRKVLDLTLTFVQSTFDIQKLHNCHICISCCF